MIGVSVIICCYNSSSRIVPTLEHLIKQKVPDYILWEVIVVNNASTDNTTEVAKQTWERSNSTVPFHIVDQPLAGLSNAREKGIEKATYEYLLFCDDDNWLDENYIFNVFKIIKENEQIGALGGYGIPYFETTPPKNILNYAGTYATGLQKAGTGEVSYQVYGAGCTFRKSAINNLFKRGFKNLLSDRSGNVLTSGGDYELCYALFLSGYKIWASDTLTFYHFIPNSRISVDYVKRNLMGMSLNNFAFTLYQILIANQRAQRPKYKSKWAWVVAVKAMILTKNFFSANKKDELVRTELKAERYSFYYLIRNRRLFNKTLNSLSNSKWIDSANH